MSIYVCSNDFSDMVFVRAVAKEFRTELKIVADLSEVSHLSKSPDKLTALFVKGENLDKRGALASLPTGISGNKVHLIVSSLRSDLYCNAIKDGSAMNVIFRKFEIPEQEGTFYARIMKAQSSKLPVQLGQILPGAKLTKQHVINAETKASLADNMISSLKQAGSSDRSAQAIFCAIDELLVTQVISGTKKDAPSSEKGIEVEYGILVNRFGATIKSRRLRGFKNALLQNPEGALQHTGQLSPSSSSEEIGLSIIIRSGASLKVSLYSDDEIEICVFFTLKPKLLDFAKQFQFISTNISSSANPEGVA